MELNDYILKILKNESRAEVPAFGVFTLEKTHADVDSAASQILPPGYQVHFQYLPDTENAAFTSGFAEFTSVPVSKAASDTENKVHLWRNTLESGQQVHLEQLGLLRLEDGIAHFEGERIAASDPQFFGLEEINLRNTAVFADVPFFTKWSERVLWLFLVILPLAGLGILALYFAAGSATQPQVVRGTHRIEDTSGTMKKDSVQTLPADSLNIKNEN